MAGRKKPVVIVMEYGDEGKIVIDAQKLLQKAGSKIQLNGIYTIGMRTAVKSFQKKHKLEVTGTIDEKTWVKLQEYKRVRKFQAKK